MPLSCSSSRIRPLLPFWLVKMLVMPFFLDYAY